jgi:hypothetical protein
MWRLTCRTVSHDDAKEADRLRETGEPEKVRVVTDEDISFKGNLLNCPHNQGNAPYVVIDRAVLNLKY